MATEVLEKVARESGLELVPDPGGAAYYGPKISVQARDAIGRTWQMSTIQYDFNQPERFELEYQAADGSRQQPVMIHSAKFGSIERFLGVLVEHYAGAFPPWLSPVQVARRPGRRGVRATTSRTCWTSCGARGSASSSTTRTTGSRRRSATRSKSKVPFVLIAGEDDRAAGAVSFRYRDGSQSNGVPVDEAIAEIVAAIAAKAQVDDRPDRVTPTASLRRVPPTGGAQPGLGIRQNGCPDGSAHTEPSGDSSRRAPSAATRRSASSRSSTMTSWCTCCGRPGSPHSGGWWSGASWNANPE